MQVGPAEQGRIIGHGLRIDATELAQHQAITDPALGGLIAPPIQVLDHQHPQDDLDRGGRASVTSGSAESGGPSPP